MLKNVLKFAVPTLNAQVSFPFYLLQRTKFAEPLKPAAKKIHIEQISAVFMKLTNVKVSKNSKNIIKNALTFFTLLNIAPRREYTV